jgi:hypothetical protein
MDDLYARHSMGEETQPLRCSVVQRMSNDGSSKYISVAQDPKV